MAEQKQQNYRNHVKFDPPFHFFLLPVGLITFGVAIDRAVRETTAISVWMVVLSFALLLSFLQTRRYAAGVQDRVIRLEERLRMERLLPADLQARAVNLTKGQFVALRFASDAELPLLVEKALANNWTNKEIKQAIVNWRPDYMRI